MSVLAIVTARSGSKGLANKNILPLAGKPLLAHSVEAALESGECDEVFLSTDSEEYAGIGRQYGARVPFLRSEALASDDAGTWDAVREALEGYAAMGKSFDRFILLQPTSPLRTAADIRNACALMREKRAKAVVSVCEAEHSPELCKTLPEDLSMESFTPLGGSVPRQRRPRYYRVNGAIYLADIPFFLMSGNIYSASCYAYIMPRERSADIDTELDYMLVRKMIHKK